jgi:alanine-alpha-ketoisovalerate/valine-pyruvate aminotransferase
MNADKVMDALGLPEDPSSSRCKELDQGANRPFGTIITRAKTDTYSLHYLFCLMLYDLKLGLPRAMITIIIADMCVKSMCSNMCREIQGTHVGHNCMG